MELVKLMAELLELVMIQQMSKSRWFGKTIIELPSYTRTKISIQFFINYKLALQKMEDILKSSLKIIVSVPKILLKKTTLVGFFEKAYKIKAVIVFPARAIFVLKYSSLNLR